VPWYLYLALKQLFATRQRFFFTAISIVSVGLGVALLLIVLGVMQGFQYKIGEVTQETQGDIQIRPEGGTIIASPAGLQSVVAKIPGVVASTPFGVGFVMVLRDQFPAMAAVQGVDVDTVEKVVPLSKFLLAGSLNDLDDDSVVLSSELASSIGATIGTKVQLFSPLMYLRSTGANVQTLPRELRVAAIFQFGQQQLDKSTVIVTLREMQDLYGLGDGVHGINLKIDPKLDVDYVAKMVNLALVAAQKNGTLPKFPNLWAESWKTINENFLWAVHMEKNMMTLILLIVVLVAAFLTMSLLIVLVFKKTREIGLLAALGATRFQLALCFCLQGVGIGVLGTAVGLVFGFTLLHYRNGAIDFITRVTGGRDAIESVYQFAQIPAHTSASDLLTIIGSAIVLSTLAGVVPAVIASRMNPVDALRNE